VMMAIAATLATTSSTNATLYASGGLTRMLAGVGQFPQFFGRESRLGEHAGLIITAGLVFVVANLVDLSAIASVGSAIALAVFVLVGMAGWRRRADTGANPVLTLAAIAVAAIVFVFFAIDTLRNDPATFVAIVLIGLLAVVLDFLVKRGRSSADVAPSEGFRGVGV
jgi:L-asparagine transporter-like permease